MPRILRQKKCLKMGMTLTNFLVTPGTKAQRRDNYPSPSNPICWPFRPRSLYTQIHSIVFYNSVKGSMLTSIYALARIVPDLAEELQRRDKSQIPKVLYCLHKDVWPTPFQVGDT